MSNWPPSWTAPQRVHNPIDEEGKRSYWQLTKEEQMTLPEYIKGTAEGTIKRMFGGKLYRLVIESIRQVGD